MTELNPLDIAIAKLELNLLEFTVTEDEVAIQGTWEALQALTQERYPDKNL